MLWHGVKAVTKRNVEGSCFLYLHVDTQVCLAGTVHIQARFTKPIQIT